METDVLIGEIFMVSDGRLKRVPGTRFKPRVSKASDGNDVPPPFVIYYLVPDVTENIQKNGWLLRSVL